MKNKQNFIGVAATCAGIFITTALQADAQQDNGAFNAGVKAAQQDAQFIQGVQASKDDELLQQLLHSTGSDVSKNGIKYGANGELERVYIVVKTPITKALPPQYALQAARKTASINSTGIFVTWLKANAKVDEKTGVIFGSTVKGNEAAGSTEEAGINNNMGSVTERGAQGAARAIMGVTEEVDKQSYELTSIFAWSKKANAGALATEAAVNQTNSNAEAARGNAATSGGQNTQVSPTGKPIEGLQSKKAKSAGLSDDF